MHKLFLSFLGVLFLVVTVQSQDTTYMDIQWNKTRKKNATYIQVVEKMPKGYLLKEFTLNKQILTEGLYMDEDFGMPCGYYCAYYDNGEKELEVDYNLKGDIDETRRYYPSGELFLKSSEVKYQFFYKSGQLQRESVLEGNKWIGKCFSEEGKDTICIEKRVESGVKADGSEWGKYLAENLKYPREAREKGIRGQVIIECNVNRSGRTINPRIVFSTNAIFNKEAIRLVRAMPITARFLVEEQPALVEFSRTIRFSLGN
ncbi:MAG: TonB family protein [Candidatus Cloacimonetes bacterium]|jgi:TonB family protein|nr:TonB family protein [Candidatus Cloacimonadota bacterium]MDY0343365.1 TonB family protein [Lentimicrobium sp.]